MNKKLILGTVQFGLDYGVNNLNGKITKAEVSKILKMAIKNKINIFDTAANYGDSENILGEYFAENPSTEFQIITKLSRHLTLEESLNQSKSRLRMNKINYLMFHSFEHYRIHKPRIDDFIKKNKLVNFDYLGVSVYSNFEISELINDDNVDVIQLPFNLLDNETQKGKLLRIAKERGKIIHVRSIFLQGLFYKRNLENLNGKLSALAMDLSEINRIANINDTDINKLAFGYVSSKEYIDGLLFGVDNLKQLEENITVSEYKLDSEIIKLIDNIKVVDIQLLNPSNWN